jgi:hypothetical protein
MVIIENFATIYGMIVKGGGIFSEHLAIFYEGSNHGMNLMPFC